MIIHFSFNVVLLIVGIVTGLLASIILLVEKTNKAANKYLAALVLLSAGALFHNFLIESSIYKQHPGLYFLPVILSLGIGPLLYLYVTRLINVRKIERVWLHLLPMLTQFILYFICFLQNEDTKYTIYATIFEPYAKPIQNIAVYISVAIYIYLSFKEINAYKLKLNSFYSNNFKVALSWLQRLLYVFMFYYLLLIFFIILSNAFHFSEYYFPSDFVRCIIIFIIAFFAVRQNSLIEMQHNIKSVEEDDEVMPEKITDPETANLFVQTDIAASVEVFIPAKPQEINTDLLQKIIDLTEAEVLYLNEELTVADLANKLGYSTKTISRTINSGLQKSFSLFINEYRVKLFQEKRASGKFNHLSIMGLAYDCGFNSKSTFNRVYKEITGASPKEQKSAID